MDWKLFAQLAVTFVVAASGWWTAHYFSARRDLTNERRKVITKYLMDAYRRLEASANRQHDPKAYRAQLEGAIADIQLLGSPRQIQLAREFAETMAQHNSGSLDKLIFELRQSLRADLQLEPVSDSVIYLRFANTPVEECRSDQAQRNPTGRVQTLDRS